jgi:hypothetical protein
LITIGELMFQGEHEPDDGGDERRPAEVQVPREQVVERIRGGDEVRHEVHGDGQRDEGERGEHQQERSGSPRRRRRAT